MGNNVDIVAATNTDTSWRFKETKKSGLMGTGGIGFTIGSSRSTHDLREQGTTQSGSFSTVGSTGGDVSITAGKQAHIGGADIIARKDISLTGDSVVIEPGHDKRTRDEKYEQKSSGLTVALSGRAGSALNSAVTTARDARGESDDRLTALKATQAALSGVQAGQGMDMAQIKGEPNNGFGVNLSLSSQKSKSEQHMQSETTAGSTLNAGSNVTLRATGSDITVAGSQIKAGQDVTLDAARDVNLLASQDTQQTSGKNSSSGGSIGVGLGVGSGGAGLSISANANSSKGHEKGNGVWQNETTVDAGNQLMINSGRDTTLAGAQVSGETVVADIGRNLTITSLQDSDHYDSRQHSVSGGLGYTFGAGGFSGSISASRDKMSSDYDSVQEQSGIFAGKGGFDVTVGNHTQLDGGVIASTADADRNSLDTGTLGFSDIHNRAEFETEHQGAGISSGGSIGSQFAGNMANGLLAGGGNSGDAEGTTRAAVSEGTLTVRDTANQQQDVADLSRDTEHANGSISPIFDKEKEQRRLQEVQLIGEIGSQAMDIARTQGELAGRAAAKDPQALEEARQQLITEGVPVTDKAVADRAYGNAMAQYGTGSTLQRGIQAATAALQGLAGGDIAGALAGASAPELAHMLKATEGNTAVNTIAHAILGGAVAAIQGNSAAAGAAGAATGELAAKAIAGVLYPDVTDLSKLSEEQKQTVSALATISAGMAGGLAGDSTAAAATGAAAGKNAAENNALSADQSLSFDKELSDCRKSGGDCQSVIDKWKQVSDKQSAETDQKLKDSPLEAQVVDKEIAQGGYDITDRPGWLSGIGADVMTSEEAKAYVQQWNGQDLAKIDQNSPEWTKYAAFASNPENQAALGSLGLLAKDLTVAAISFMGRNTATATVSAAEVGMKWGQGNMKQGMPWEDYVGASLPADARLPQNFKTFDYYDGATKTAVSAKSMDTQTMAKLANPNQVYGSIKGNIDAAAKFKEYALSGRELTSSMISNKEIQLAVPANTTKTQWTEINRAIEYGKAQGIKVTVTQVK